MLFRVVAVLLGVVLVATSCSTPARPSISVAEPFELERFMGEWYVLASIPTFLEKNAYNATETYEMGEPGEVLTTFTFNRGALDGPERTLTPKAFVREEKPAAWDMQFIWPFKAEYLVAYRDRDYQTTIVARSKRDFVWIMARRPDVAPEVYADLVSRVEALGYDTSKLRKVPHEQTAPRG